MRRKCGLRSHAGPRAQAYPSESWPTLRSHAAQKACPRRPRAKCHRISPLDRRRTSGRHSFKPPRPGRRRKSGFLRSVRPARHVVSAALIAPLRARVPRFPPRSGAGEVSPHAQHAADHDLGPSSTTSMATGPAPLLAPHLTSPGALTCHNIQESKPLSCHDFCRRCLRRTSTVLVGSLVAGRVADWAASKSGAPPS